MYKVVVIDDEMLVRKGIVLETDWKSLDCTVVAEAGNGLEGIEAVHKYNPDLLICDIKMPKMDGIEMLRQLRKEEMRSVLFSLLLMENLSTHRVPVNCWHRIIC